MGKTYKSYKEVTWDRDRWPNFTAQELADHTNGEYFHEPLFLDMLQRLRDGVGQSLHVNSGHRSPLHNARVGGAPLSLHKKIAVDLSLAGHDRFEVLHHAMKAGFTGYGLAANFIHLDHREMYGMRRAVWFYSKQGPHLWQMSSTFWAGLSPAASSGPSGASHPTG